MAVSESTGLFRTIRGVGIKEEDNFEITKSDSIANLLLSQISSVTVAATIIGFITLAIGIIWFFISLATGNGTFYYSR